MKVNDMYVRTSSQVARSWRQVLIALLAITAAAVPLASAAQAAPDNQAAVTAALVNVQYNEAHPILAYYYAWWETDKLTSGPYQALLIPFAGARDISDDDSLLRTHITEARSAGIDGWIVNRGSDVARLLDVAHGSDFRVTLQVDSDNGPEAQLQTFYQHANDPGIVTYAGQPVVFFWRAWAHPQAYWTDLRDRIDPDHNALWIADGDQFGFMAGPAWDGISPYAIAWSGNPTGQLPAWGAKARAAAPGKLYIPPVSPGCDDSGVRAATCVRDRGDGAYYQSTLNGALAAKPQWAVVVSTWNEWMEATSIEPATAYGDLYLKLTREFATAFKGA